MANEAEKPEKQDLFGDQGALVPPTRAMGAESATGQALADKSEVPQGEDRGSKVPVEGEAVSDWDIANGNGGANGAQTQPARFTSNGQLPHNMIPTPSGAVPVGATALSPEDAKKLVEDTNDAHDAYVNRGTERRKLSKATVQRLSIPDIQAISEQRGYDVPAFGGVRVMRQAFLDAQDADERIGKDEPKLSRTNAGGAVGTAATVPKASAATASGSNQAGQGKTPGTGSAPPKSTK